MAAQVAHADVPVLITGPNGAGKEVLADIVHANSARKTQAYVKVNAGALPDQLIEAELFGTEAGAFTGAKARAGRFEAADGGTLFLDEIATFRGRPGRLLRVLQTGNRSLGQHHAPSQCAPCRRPICHCAMPCVNRPAKTVLPPERDRISCRGSEAAQRHPAAHACFRTPERA
jgi:hypothetical protein